MESPVVVNKPPEYYCEGTQNTDKGFPFSDEEGGEADEQWRSLAERHPDIAARLRATPAWGRKRRSSHHQPGREPADDLFAGLGEHFQRFPFGDLPPEFSDRWSSFARPREQPAPDAEQTSQTAPPPQTPSARPPSSTIATQTEEDIVSAADVPPEQSEPAANLTQYGLRNTVDLGQKTPTDSSVLDAQDDHNQRSMSAPPDNRVPHPNHAMGNMMGGNQPTPPQNQQEHHASSNVRHIPIFVEGRDEPVINKAHPEPSAKAEAHPQYAPPQQEYFEREPPMGFHHPPNYSRTFGAPFNKGYRQGPQQPFAPQAAYQQGAAPRGRSQSPKPPGQPQQQYTQIPVHHDPPKQQHHQHPQQHQHFQQPPQQRQQSPQPPPTAPQTPPPTQPSANDPISKILNIQKDVLELMNEVEGFTGKKTDKKYIYLDEMLTRNLIKLDDIETEGKENIRQARREAIKCIQKCIAVLEAKADGKIPTTPQPNAGEKPEFNGDGTGTESENTEEQTLENSTKEEDNKDKQKIEKEEQKAAADVPATTENTERTPEETKETTTEVKVTPKKTKKVIKRDKSKEKDDSIPMSKDNAEKTADIEMKDSTGNTTDTVQPMETETAVPSQ